MSESARYQPVRDGAAVAATAASRRPRPRAAQSRPSIGGFFFETLLVQLIALLVQLAVFVTFDYWDQANSDSGLHVAWAWTMTLFITIMFAAMYYAFGDFHPIPSHLEARAFAMVMYIPSVLAQISFVLTVLYLVGQDKFTRMWVLVTITLGLMTVAFIGQCCCDIRIVHIVPVAVVVPLVPSDNEGEGDESV